jgi:hypothetical protein
MKQAGQSFSQTEKPGISPGQKKLNIQMAFQRLMLISNLLSL